MHRNALLPALALLLAGCGGAPESAKPAATSAEATRVPLDFAARRDQAERTNAWAAMPEPQRQAVREAQMAFTALPADQQQALQARFDAQDANDQRGWLLGPDIGATWPQLQPLLGTVPEDERAALLRVLRAMPPAQLQALGRIAWRTPPAARELLRRQLIAAPRPAEWLQAQAER